MQDSNLRPPVCKTDALPAELTARGSRKLHELNCKVKGNQSQKELINFFIHKKKKLGYAYCRIFKSNRKNQPKVNMSLFEYLKYIFFFLLFLQVAPVMFESIKKQYAAYISPQAKVGVISIKDAIMSSTPLSNQFQSFFKNNEIKAILIKMDSGGGATGACESIFREIISLKQMYPKPTVTLVENVCASGAYWIACSTDYILSPGTAIIGSIGVIIPYLFKFDEFLEQYKIEHISLKSGAHKGVTDPFFKMGKEEKEFLQKALDNTYEQFVQSVAYARKIALDQKDRWADGKIFPGLEAKQLKLIDKIGSLQDAITIIREKASIKGEIEWVYPPKHISILNRLFGDSSQDEENPLSSLCANMIKKLFYQHTSFQHIIT